MIPNDRLSQFLCPNFCYPNVHMNRLSLWGQYPSYCRSNGFEICWVCFKLTFLHPQNSSEFLNTPSRRLLVSKLLLHCAWLTLTILINFHRYNLKITLLNLYEILWIWCTVGFSKNLCDNSCIFVMYMNFWIHLRTRVVSHMQMDIQEFGVEEG